MECGEGITEDFQEEVMLKGIPNLHCQITRERRKSKLVSLVRAKGGTGQEELQMKFSTFIHRPLTGPALGCLVLHKVSVWGTLSG